MQLSERQAHITEMLRQSDFVGVEELARHFQVTTQTVRRDLNFLCEHGFYEAAQQSPRLKPPCQHFLQL